MTCLAAKWHVCCTIDSFESAEETPTAQIASCTSQSYSSEDEEEEKDGEDALDNTKMVPKFSTISFQKRQALGKSRIFTNKFHIS